MKLEDIIKIASQAYIHNGVEAGDGLAQFICNELRETFDESASDEEQLSEAVRCMEKAEQEVRDVTKALISRWYEVV